MTLVPAVVQSALVVILAFVLKLGADAVGLPIDEAVLTAVATSLVAYVFSKIGLLKTQEFLAKK